VNVEPRFSPDGKRIVFVSTAYNKRFHIFVGELTDHGLEHVERLTGENKSPLRRYYYSAYDHEISPTFSPDGKSIFFVSNRGHIHGTGGFWQMEAKPGAEPHEIHYEETNWRARPDVSPDGKRLLYSSYLGRNWHTLWLLPIQGGDALPISYGNFDEVGARWSPDGREIAFISNRSGNTELWIHDVAGGAEHPLAIGERHVLRPSGRIALSIRGPDGKPGAARVSVLDANGRFHAPLGAWIHADDGYDRALQPFEAHYFHASGDIEVEVPAGEVSIDVMRGFRYPFERLHATVKAGATTRLASAVEPVANRAEGGGRWSSGDVHVHMNYGGLYRNTPEHLLEQARAEDLDVVHAVIVNKEQRVPDIAYSGHGIDAVSTASNVIVHGQEFHTSYWGHLGILAPSGGTLLPGYAGYPNTAAASLVPTNADVADMAHAMGALVGYVHPFDEEIHPFDAKEALSNEFPVDVALGKVDYIEIVGFADHRITASVWYRMLNLGFRLPAAGGTDAMANYASLRGPVGMNRVFVRVPEGPVSVPEWQAGLKAGRTFATNGPLLDFTLGGQPIGGEVALAAPNAQLPFTAHLKSIVPIDHLEVVCNGVVVRNLPLTGARMAADAKGTVPANKSGWCVLRATSGRAEYPVLDDSPYATTSPVYVSVKGARPKSSADAKFFAAWIDRVTESTERYPDWNSSAEKVRVLAQLKAARAVYAALE
ncbi:MAG TPA: CehA/McbA family metallohydrolase, partial [Polyangiaceae bacterium]|nr:CehA/McbA family metallohydrolase [Polyangiaceae bacterium]